MPFRSPGHHLSPRRSGWLYSVLAILAMAAQLVVALAPLDEARDQRMASHVEAGGTQTHHAHSDATCAACQARSIQGSAVPVASAFLAVVSPHERIVAAADAPVSRDRNLATHPRAPPPVI